MIELCPTLFHSKINLCIWGNISFGIMQVSSKWWERRKYGERGKEEKARGERGKRRWKKIRKWKNKKLQTSLKKNCQYWSPTSYFILFMKIESSWIQISKIKNEVYHLLQLEVLFCYWMELLIFFSNLRKKHITQLWKH